MRTNQLLSVKILLIFLLPTALHSEEVMYDGGRFRLSVPSGFAVQPVLEYEGEGVSTHVFIRPSERKLASIIQVSIFPPNPDIRLETADKIRRACVVGLEQHFSSLKRGRLNFSHSDPEDIDIDGVPGVKSTWIAVYKSPQPAPELPEKGLFYVVADERGFLTVRVAGDERNFSSITQAAAQAIEMMTIEKPADSSR